jgi:hypothetical protein
VNKDQSATEIELNEMSPETIAIIMFIVSMIFPVGIAINAGYIVPVFLTLASIFSISLPLTLLNVLFAIWVVRYYQGKTTFYSVLLLGILSLTVPTVILLFLTGLLGNFVFYIPIPVQFIIGMIILWKYEGPEVEVYPMVEEPEPELYGTSPRVIAFFMILATLILPFGYISGSSFIIFYFDFFDTGFYGLFWVLGYELFYSYGFHILPPSLWISSCSLSIFNLLFAILLVRYYQGRTSKQHVLLIGAVSFIYPALLVLTQAWFFSLPPYLTGIVWPIPIQFIIGLILLYKIPGPELMESSIK